MLQSFLSSVTVRLQGRLVPTHSYYYREGGKRASPKRASSRYEMEGDRTAVRLGLTRYERHYIVCTILRGIETLVVAMNSCEVKCEYMTLYGQGNSGPSREKTQILLNRSLAASQAGRCS